MSQLSHTPSRRVLFPFDDADTYAAALTVDSTADLAAVAQYLQTNDIGNAGDTVYFTATVGTANTYVYQQTAAGAAET